MCSLSQLKSYLFTAVSAADLSPGDLGDPFRFYRDDDPPPVRSSDLVPRFSLETVDVDGNREIDSHDRFFYVSPDHRRLSLSSELGLRILNYFVDPNILKAHQWGMVVRSSSAAPGPIDGEVSLQEISEITPYQREEIADRSVPFWEVDGHLDLDILEGLRTYTDAENRRWTGWSGLGIFLNGRYVKDQLINVAGVAGGFILGEYEANSVFMWQMYSTNFSSKILGSLTGNSRRYEEIRSAQATADAGLAWLSAQSGAWRHRSA